jgi:hypothetical protein
MLNSTRSTNRTYTTEEAIRAGAPAGFSLVQQLRAFGTADEIADFFRSEGVQGHRRELAACPIAVWVTNVMGPCEVNEEGISFTFCDRKGMEIALNSVSTPAMREFVRRFDSDGYPDLVAV